MNSNSKSNLNNIPYNKLIGLCNEFLQSNEVFIPGFLLNNSYITMTDDNLVEFNLDVIPESDNTEIQLPEIEGKKDEEITVIKDKLNALLEFLSAYKKRIAYKSLVEKFLTNKVKLSNLKYSIKEKITEIDKSLEPKLNPDDENETPEKNKKGIKGFFNKIFKKNKNEQTPDDDENDADAKRTKKDRKKAEKDKDTDKDVLLMPKSHPVGSWFRKKVLYPTIVTAGLIGIGAGILGSTALTGNTIFNTGSGLLNFSAWASIGFWSAIPLTFITYTILDKATKQHYSKKYCDKANNLELLRDLEKNLGKALTIEDIENATNLPIKNLVEEIEKSREKVIEYNNSNWFKRNIIGLKARKEHRNQLHAMFNYAKVLRDQYDKATTTEEAERINKLLTYMDEHLTNDAHKNYNATTNATKKVFENGDIYAKSIEGTRKQKVATTKGQFANLLTRISDERYNKYLFNLAASPSDSDDYADQDDAVNPDDDQDKPKKKLIISNKKVSKIEVTELDTKYNIKQTYVGGKVIYVSVSKAQLANKKDTVTVKIRDKDGNEIPAERDKTKVIDFIKRKLKKCPENDQELADDIFDEQGETDEL